MHATKTCLFLTLVLTLAGCSSMGDKTASIEDRNAEAQRGVTQKAAAEKAAAEKKASEEKAAEEKAAAAKAAAEKAVEVKPVTLEAATGQPLDATDKSGVLTAGSIKDPASELSKRVIYFDYDSSVIKDEFQGLIELHAKYLKQFKDAKVILQGHTDDRGSREYNIALGQRRADAVRKALGLLAVPDSQMEAVSFGEEKPAATDETDEARAKNRRAELHYQGE